MQGYLVFDVDFYAFCAEKLLKRHNIDYKMTQIPRELSSDCTLAIYVDDIATAKALLDEGNIPSREIKDQTKSKNRQENL